MISVLFAAALMLSDQDNRSVTLATFAGHPLVVSFVAARCTDVCPLVDAQIERAAERERERHGSMRFLTITLDPDHDTHADIVHLARVFNADEYYWRITSGPVGVVHAYMHEFGVVTAPEPPTDLPAHTSTVIVLDAQGRVAAALLPSVHLADDIERTEER